ncbi:hypothetical protein JT358_12810 [Micrococcales bacterium 31B]|nr:hypothetical protein [Micrococcales bacterium 31B]
MLVLLKRWAHLAVVPLMMLAALANLQGPLTQDPSYGLAATSNSASLNVVLAPLAALGGALVGMRARSAYHLLHTSARSARAHVVATSLSIPVCAAAIITVHAVVQSRDHVDAPVLLLSWLVLLAWNAFGLALGLLTWPALALPISLLAAWWWQVIPPSLDAPWVRHMTGYLVECCAVDTVLDPRAMWATITVAAGLLAASWLLVLRQLSVLSPLVKPSVAPLAALMLIAGTTVGCLIALPLSYDASVARSGQLRCEGSAPTLCLWPEHESRRSQLREVITVAWASWGQVTELPATVTERRSLVRDPSIAQAVFMPGANEVQLVSTLATGIVSGRCPGYVEGDPPVLRERIVQPTEAEALLVARASVAMGATADMLTSAIPPDLDWQALLRDDNAAQAARLARQLQAFDAQCAAAVAGSA